MEFTAYGKNSEKAVDAAIEEVQKLDAMLSAENSKSEVYALNEQGNLQATDDLAELILRGKEIYQETDGLFDDTIYPVMKLWGFPTGNYHVPTAAEVQKKLALVDGNKVEIQTRDSDEKGRDSKEKAKFVTLGADQQIDFWRNCKRIYRSEAGRAFSGIWRFFRIGFSWRKHSGDRDEARRQQLESGNT